MPFELWDGVAGATTEETEQDPLHQVADFLEEQERRHQLAMAVATTSDSKNSVDVRIMISVPCMA